MKPNTAVALLAGAAALWLLGDPHAPAARRRAGHLAAAVTVLIGLLTLIEYAAGWNFGIDEALFDDPAGNPPGRPAPNTAAALCLTGLMLLGLDYETRRGRRPAQWLAAAVALIAALGLIGYAYGVQALYKVAGFSSLALHTAAALAALALGALAARPQHGFVAILLSDSAGGHMARRLLPAAVLVPPVLGGLRLWGERAGLYGPEFGVALMVMASLVVFVALIGWNARSLAALDAERRRAAADLKRANESLEARVAERTAALEQANQSLAQEVAERRRFEEQFRGLFEAAPDAVVISDTAGRIVLANAQAGALFGYGRDELVGQPIERLVPERFRERHAGHRRGYVAEPRTRPMGAALELYARRKDGSEFPVAISLSPIHTKDGTLIFSDIRDVTAHKQAERELRASEARFRAVADTANDAIVSADRRGDVVYFNRAAEQIFGYTADEVVGRPLTLLMPERFHAAHRAGLERFLGGAASRVVGKTVELAGRRKNGEEFPLELSLASWKTGDEIYFTGMLRDVTPRKEAERRIEGLHEGLKRRAAELEALNQELEAFSYSVSHDLRAPLRSIDGFSQALLEDYGGGLDADGRDFLMRVRAAAQRMGLLIDDLLKLSRVTRTEVAREPTDVSALVAAIAEERRHRDPDRAVEVAIAPGLTAEADPRLLRIALENLLDNAWKFTSTRAQARIEFGAESRGGAAVYYVRDNGVGFDMAYAGKLFGAFQRLHDAREFPGTGIGLATVQRVVHKHGGRVWAEGAVDRGATFYFTL